MNPASPAPEVRYAALVETLRDDERVAVGISGKKGFGSSSLTVSGKIFAMLVGERLVLKLPRQRVDALVEAGWGERFDPGHGRLMKEWVSLNHDAAPDWVALAREALVHVAPNGSTRP